jgi:alkylation response protein AidB-like acyl-CoA dehydrogenase
MTAGPEAAYAQSWRAMYAAQSEWRTCDLAAAGGKCALDMACVFIAGYQAAIRAIFPDAKFTGWAAFAVSEDRSETDPLPGLTARAEDDVIVLNGHKTWVAAVDHVKDLVVRAAGSDAGYYLVPRAASGLSLERNPSPGMLPTLSQGKAHFDGVRLTSDHKLDDQQVERFGVTEAFCIYTAFAAMACKLAEDARVDDVHELAVDLLGQAASLDTSDAAGMATFDDGIQQLRRRMFATIFNGDEGFERDQKLIAMYSKGIQARAA